MMKMGARYNKAVRLLIVRDRQQPDRLAVHYSQVRNAIDTVFRERTVMTLHEIELEATIMTDTRSVNLTVMPVQMENLPNLVVISITDVTEQVQNRRRLETAQAEQSKLVDELSAANKRLSDMNKGLLDANEELQAANEELVLAQEELQASNEELEATNEELQATNEELETNNEELQATNEELETTNEELASRTVELKELSKMLASERMRLAQIVELAPFYIIVLRGPNLIVEAFNPRYARHFGEQEVIGRPFGEVFKGEESTTLINLIQDVYRQDTVLTSPRMLVHLCDERNESLERCFVYTIIPTHGSDGKIDGACIYGEDVTEQVARESEERRENLKLMVEHADQIALALIDVQTTELLQASPRFLDIIERARGYQCSDIIGRKWRELAPFSSGEEAEELLNSVIKSHAPRRLPEVRIKLARDKKETVWD